MGVRRGEWGRGRSLLALSAFHCLSFLCPVVFFLPSPSVLSSWDMSTLCAPEAFELPCVFCPEGISLVLYLVIRWLCSFFTLLYSFLMFTSLTTQLKNSGGAITFSWLKVKVAAFCGAEYTKGGYQSSTAFPV